MVKTARKAPQPILKSTAAGSLLAHVIVSKFADHQPLHRQEKMFERHSVNIPSRACVAGWRIAQICYRRCMRRRKKVSSDEGDRHRRYQREGPRPKAALRADGCIWSRPQS